MPRGHVAGDLLVATDLPTEICQLVNSPTLCLKAAHNYIHQLVWVEE